MWTQLIASDGFEFYAYAAGLENRPGVVVIQEIFGVNEHIRDVCDRLAAAGFRAIAPALFDRVQAGIELAYDGASIHEGRRLVGELGGLDKPLLDIQACVQHIRSADMPVGVTGFCYGGTLSWLAAQRLDHLKAAVGYYGGMIPKFLEEKPRCPVMLHFAEMDEHVPITDVDAVRAAYPEVELHSYPAEHGFNCDRRESYQEESARLAWVRTLEFFHKWMA